KQVLTYSCDATFRPHFSPLASRLPYNSPCGQQSRLESLDCSRNKGGDMLATMMQGAETEETAVEKLWRAVIASTVEEWVNGPLRQKREAESFLFSDNQDYRTVCFSAGINPDHLRGRL